MYVVIVLVFEVDRFVVSFDFYIVTNKLVNLSYLYCSFVSRLCEDQASMHAQMYEVCIYNFLQFSGNVIFFNPLTPELNSSAQRCLTNFLLRILLLGPYILLMYA
jgi:hypothetical protein